MDNLKITGVIVNSGSGSDVSLTIPIGDYRITIISDDNCGAGKGEIRRSELYVYHKSENPSSNMNSEIFGTDFVVVADSETLLHAIDYVRNLK